MCWTLSISQGAIDRAGANVNSAIKISNAALARWSDQAEAKLGCICNTQWASVYSGLQADLKPILADYCDVYIAKNMINYDMSGFTNQTEAQTMLNVLDNDMKKDIEVLKEKNVAQKLMGV